VSATACLASWVRESRCGFWSSYGARTTLLGGRFESTVTGLDLFKLTFTNLLLVLFTLGFGLPWAEVRTMKFLADHLLLRGAVDLSITRQRAMAASATGDALSSVLETDGFDAGLDL